MTYDNDVLIQNKRMPGNSASSNNSGNGDVTAYHVNITNLDNYNSQ